MAESKLRPTRWREYMQAHNSERMGNRRNQYFLLILLAIVMILYDWVDKNVSLMYIYIYPALTSACVPNYTDRISFPCLENKLPNF